MGLRQKKKNLLKNNGKLNKRILELESTIRERDRTINNQTYDVKRLLNEVNGLQMRLHVLGTMPVYKELEPVGVNNYSMVEAQTLIMQPIPWGTFRIVDEKELEKILNEKKKEMAKELATAILDYGLAQIIIHTPKDYEEPFEGTPLMPKAKATIGMKLYVIPWEQTKVYAGEVVRMKVLAEENSTNYAEMCRKLTDEQRQRWLEGNREGF